jgi:cell division protein FtsZ
MTITFTAPEQNEQLKPRITVIGVGGAGGNAVNNMISKQLSGVDFVVANTDAQALMQSTAERKIQLGRAITQGLGAGSRPDMGRAAAEEAIEDINEFLQGSHMLFIAAGMGGGTGTGAAPVIARLAREMGMLTVGVVTKPFQFEGSNRMKIADAGIHDMQQFVDTLIVIPNQNLFRIANEKTTFADAFAMADDVLHCGVRGVTDLMVVPGLINLDFADIRSVMSEMGKAMMGTGEAEGEDRARLAAEAAISNPLLDDVSMKGAQGVLINITGGPDMTLFEVDEAANRIGDEVDPNANIIFGSALDPNLEGRIRVSVVATGIDVNTDSQPRPVLSVYTGDAVATMPIAPAVPAPQIAAVSAPPQVMAQGGPVARIDVTAEPPAKIDIAEIVEQEAAFTAEAMAAPDPTDTTADSPDPVPMQEEPFIPPPPVEVARQPEPTREIAADPFREAELLNAAPKPTPKRGTGLFHHMTGGRWSRKQEQEAAPVITPRPSPARQEPMPAAVIEPKPEPKVIQPKLKGVEPQKRQPGSQSEEDLLDIPAFLRRQAN